MQHILAQPLPTPSDDAPAIDLDAFRMLASVLGPDRMRRMADTFFVDADRRMTLLERDDAAPADLQDHAHALVSMAGHLGLRQLSALCMDLQERARRNGGLDRLPALRRAISEGQRAVDAAVAGGVLQEACFVEPVDADLPKVAAARAGREWTGGGHAATE